MNAANNPIFFIFGMSSAACFVTALLLYALNIEDEEDSNDD